MLVAGIVVKGQGLIPAADGKEARRLVPRRVPLERPYRRVPLNLELLRAALVTEANLTVKHAESERGAVLCPAHAEDA